MSGEVFRDFVAQIVTSFSHFYYVAVQPGFFRELDRVVEDLKGEGFAGWIAGSLLDLITSVFSLLFGDASLITILFGGFLIMFIVYSIIKWLLP